MKNEFTDLEKFYKTAQNTKDLKTVESNKELIKKENSEKEIKNAVNKINRFLDAEGTHLQYEKHDVLNQMIITVVDNNTNKVIEEIPSKQILDMVAKMCEMAGILVNKKA
ncbi:flagellar protein FlaG [Clostridium frigoriphilum]|uniref:Flagellar protein FlaG n=2 Tax=Clostridiaceae TaxID=31979 RepID=A0ABU7UIP5_9CLOT|nr:flagellar protein FlaG [Clostridium sp. DSM 17811]